MRAGYPGRGATMCAMQGGNLERVLAANDAYNARESERFPDFYAEEVIAVPDASVFPEARPLRGNEQFRAWVEEIGSAWGHDRWRMREAFELAPDRVLVRGDWGGRGVASGIESYSSITGLFTLDDGMITQVEYFFDHAQALAAAGLPAGTRAPAPDERG